MTGEIIKQKMVEVRYDAYRSFFDHAWVRQLADVVNGTALDEPVFNLNIAWKAAANTQSLPWLIIRMLGAFADGYVKADDPHAARLVRNLRESIIREIGGGLSRTKEKALHDAIVRIDEKIKSGLDAHPVVFDVEETWQNCLKHPDFVISLWGSQQICYAAVYYAYEDFLTRCVAIATGKPDYRMPRRPEFGRDFAQSFGATTRDRCWSATIVNVARLTRHAIVHNGGRVTDELAKLPHGLTIQEGEIQIMAPDTAALYVALKSRVGELVTTAVAMPQFRPRSNGA